MGFDLDVAPSVQLLCTHAKKLKTDVYFSRGDDKPTLGWMYKEEKPELDEYLLGRKIDKYVDEEAQKEIDKGI